MTKTNVHAEKPAPIEKPTFVYDGQLGVGWLYLPMLCLIMDEPIICFGSWVTCYLYVTDSPYENFLNGMGVIETLTTINFENIILVK